MSRGRILDSFSTSSRDSPRTLEYSKSMGRNQTLQFASLVDHLALPLYIPGIFHLISTGEKTLSSPSTRFQYFQIATRNLLAAKQVCHFNRFVITGVLSSRSFCWVSASGTKDSVSKTRKRSWRRTMRSERTSKSPSDIKTMLECRRGQPINCIIFSKTRTEFSARCHHAIRLFCTLVTKSSINTPI